MPKAHRSRHGSMQVWPRVRAKRIYPRINGFSKIKEAKPQGFAGYKVGMTHVIITDGRKNSITKGEDIFIPVTILECPPIKIAGVRLYKKGYKAINPVKDILAKLDKELGRKINAPKKELANISEIKDNDFDALRLLVQTQPKLTSIGKKKPELFELAIGGKKEEQLAYIKENLGKEISVKEVFSEGQLIDIHAITKGKGMQGPVKRFGVKIRHHKSEKTTRGPGSLGGWSEQGHVMYRVAHAGQMGFHSRVDYNKQIMLIGDKPEQVNIKGGFNNYGVVKNNYLLIKGSIAGPPKRIIRIETAIRPNKKVEQSPQTIQYVSMTSKRGN